jgi:hypothetical protein
VKKGVSPEKKLRRNGLDSPLISRVSTRKLANSRTDHPSSQHRESLSLGGAAFVFMKLF